MNTKFTFIQENTILFRILDGIADATNILLAVWLLGVLIIGLRRGLWGGRAWLASILCVMTVYIVKVIEQRLDIWQSFGSDYSTHSALAAALVISLWFLEKGRRVLIIGVFIAYEILIVLLGFHSVLDVISTLLIVTPLQFLCWKMIHPLNLPSSREKVEQR